MCSASLPVLCVTNRRLVEGDFLQQMQRVVEARPAAVLLREKDLEEEAYLQLARQVDALCRDAEAPLVVHTHVAVARSLQCRHLHMTLPVLQGLDPDERTSLQDAFELSTSCHSVDDALLAQQLGCTRIIAGHVYETNSKPGLKPRGLVFLEQVCQAVKIPVWAIGGVNQQRLPELASAGAAGACMMSAFMKK